MMNAIVQKSYWVHLMLRASGHSTPLGIARDIIFGTEKTSWGSQNSLKQ